MTGAMLGLLLSAVWVSGLGDETRMSLMSEGATNRLGGYMPQRLELSPTRPASLTKAPGDLKSPLYGFLPMLGGNKFHVVLDEPEGAPARLLVDSNGNGDVTDDPAPEWTGRPAGSLPDGKALTQYSGSMTVDLGSPEKPYAIRLGAYRFDKNAPGRAAYANIILFYTDYATRGTARIGDKDYSVMLVDRTGSADFRGRAAGESEQEYSGVSIVIDRNANDRVDSRGEQFDVRKPFNIGGVTYELADISRDGLSFRVVRSEKTVDEIPLPPDHTVGRRITPFEATLHATGKPLRFPQDYKGKVVMLDFWATWCGPCMAEVPGLVEVYEKHKDHGFDVLGVSLDQKGAEERLNKTLADKRMAWPQVYDGGYWKARVAVMYGIDSIPAAFLVDGDTGEILAVGGRLRGKALDTTVEEALRKKKGEQH